MIRAVIFDFGGVLVSDAWARSQLAVFDAMLGLPAGSLHTRLYSGPAWEAFSTGLISAEDYWAQVGAPFEERLPPAFRAFIDPFYGERLDPAMVRLAWQVHGRLQVALLSNATPDLPRRLAAEPDLTGLFDVVVISALEGLRKPDPAIYERVCRRLRLSPPACVLIDDKIRNVEAAIAFGMSAILHRDAATTRQALIDLGVLPGGESRG
jgi:putative hydrolase of the HAD superfamily